MGFLQSEMMETIAGVGTVAWIPGFMAVCLMSSAGIHGEGVDLFIMGIQLYLTFGWIYMMCDALGLIRKGQAQMGWFVGILLLGGIAAPLYWIKVLRGSRKWQALADRT